MDRILTIQDISCVGQCSLTVALPVISAFGVETCVLPSAVLSTHTGGFSGFTCRDLTDDFPAIKEHWKKENIRFDGFYTGYIANGKQIDYIFDIVDELSRNDAKLIVDPAMADFGKMYRGFDKGFVNEMARLVKRADYALPNITECAFLTNNEYRERDHTDEYVERLIYGLQKLGAKNVVLKGVRKGNEIGVATYDGERIKYFSHEHVEGSMHGTGDVYASCFVGCIAIGFSVEEAAKYAAQFTLSAIKKTVPVKDHRYGVLFEKIIPEITALVK